MADLLLVISAIARSLTVCSVNRDLTLAGDPARLVAYSTRARTGLGWRPQHADLATVVEHGWQWEQVLADE